ncbi:MAG: bifunctional oligoribonuclease/PAP phosphatase NrnA [Gemmatimonadetes bacterium]|nr:bifunctional oligoribonuclease/PAP phosphatase NrnA [Gemmatimonadota bacterium]
MDDRGKSAGEAFVPVPEERRDALERVLAVIRAARSVALTTHVNADGDGAGCEAALAAWLSRQDKRVAIVNPTPFPALYRHLVEQPDPIVDPGTVRTGEALRGADLLIVLDTSEVGRIGRIAAGLRDRSVAVIDHHLPSEEPIAGTVVQEDRACATGELVYDLLVTAGEPRPWPAPVARGIYTAILTDTGSFRFSNTTARAHAIAGDLIRHGVEPEDVYRRIYATVPLRRIRLLQHALARLETDAQFPITWIVLERKVMEETGTSTDDLDGIVEQARSVDGTEIAILFRETSDGSTKVSLRSSGAANVNRIAREFGGGGHVKASGALVPEPPAHVVPRVLEAARAVLRDAGLDSRDGAGAR